MRLLPRRTEDYLKGPSQMWDIGGDNHETFDGAGILQFADILLDDPEFEVVIFQGEERGQYAILNIWGDKQVIA
jgi:succinyl-CoA synthetase alpha subunit